MTFCGFLIFVVVDLACVSQELVLKPGACLDCGFCTHCLPSRSFVQRLAVSYPSGTDSSACNHSTYAPAGGLTAYASHNTDKHIRVSTREHNSSSPSALDFCRQMRWDRAARRHWLCSISGRGEPLGDFPSSLEKNQSIFGTVLQMQ